MATASLNQSQLATFQPTEQCVLWFEYALGSDGSKKNLKEWRNYKWDWVLAILASRWSRLISRKHKNKHDKRKPGDSEKETLCYVQK